MPKQPYQPLTTEEALLLQAWIEAGGPGNQNPVSQLEPTFESIRKNILVPKCLICHKAGGETDHIPLSTREDLIDSPLEIVIPGNAEESMFMIVVQEGARKQMPPPESGMTPLAEEEKKVVENWILEGAKD
jgi:uncharacterized membrane protein